MNKDQRRKVAEETVQFIEQGYYSLPKYGANARFELELSQTVNGTRLYDAGALDQGTLIEVTAQTTLQAAQELAAKVEGVGVLNFASAKNPGGGFLRGAHAQEESLVRASTLYASLSSDAAKPYYDAHREAKDAWYSDRMIFTKHVVVFRDDVGNILKHPYRVSVVTAAAPNVRALTKQGRKIDPEELEEILSSRLRKIFRIFTLEGLHTLVLGAWGCGVFGNHPNHVASIFAGLLEPAYQYEAAGEFAGRFKHIRFAIPSAADPNYQAFRTRFDLDNGQDSVTWGRVL